MSYKCAARDSTSLLINEKSVVTSDRTRVRDSPLKWSTESRYWSREHSRVAAHRGISGGACLEQRRWSVFLVREGQKEVGRN